MPKVKVNNVDLYYEIRGTGEPLVIIMGLATDISEWESVIGPLSQHFKVIAFDNRGAGRTDKPNSPYSIELMASDTAQLMSKLGIKQANVMGISMGGRIALELTLQNPKLVKKLILVSSSARVTTISRLLVPFLGIFSSIALRGKYPQPRYAFKRQLRASRGYNCTLRLNEINIPTLIMHGSRDKTVPFVLDQEMHLLIKGSQLSSFKGGHLFILGAERQVSLETISNFIQK